MKAICRAASSVLIVAAVVLTLFPDSNAFAAIGARRGNEPSHELERLIGQVVLERLRTPTSEQPICQFTVWACSCVINDPNNSNNVILCNDTSQQSDITGDPCGCFGRRGLQLCGEDVEYC